MVRRIPTSTGGEAYGLGLGFRSTIWAMQVATGTVVNGKIVLEGVSLTEGEVVTVISRGADERFSLTEAQEDELLAAMAEIERGEFVTLEELLQSLPKRG
ncbi:MAG TPA: hypothetical protein VH394_21245 [Thermoanaerobaculia bacterium]|nr:hypothetical protein [Thermoanaerobaculia bacterium]